VPVGADCGGAGMSHRRSDERTQSPGMYCGPQYETRTVGPMNITITAAPCGRDGSSGWTIQGNDRAHWTVER
jgi:hypothetical protein